jgi:hypothetical protein
MNSPVPGICVFGIAFALMANQAFRHDLDLIGQALVVCTGIALMVAFLGAMTLSSSNVLPGQPWTAKAVRNYNCTVILVCRTAGYGLLACVLFMTAAVVAGLENPGLTGIVCVLAIFTAGVSLFTYLQGPLDPYEY